MPDNQTDNSALADALQEVTAKVQVLVREELELAQAEIKAKATTLVKGVVVGIVAGSIAVFGISFALHTLAWLLWRVVTGGDNGGSVWVGFALTTLILFIVAGIAGFLAYKWLKVGPPKPDMAIQEAQKIKETVQSNPSSGKGRR